MAGKKQIPTLEDMAFRVLAKQGLFSIDIPADTSLERQHAILSLVEEKMLASEMHDLLQAVIDDDRKKVAALLDENPKLLLIKAGKDTEIESQKTWQKINVENEDALSIAVKRKQIKMIELLLPYYDKLEQTEEVIKTKIEALSAWKSYEIQRNAAGVDEIVIPREYAIYAQSLIDVFKEETFPNGVERKLSEKTELALSSLFNILLPKKAVNLDNYLDPELFLLTLYKKLGCNGGLDTFETYDQKNAFCIRVIGLAQSVLSPEVAKIFCEGLYSVVERNREISPYADSLGLPDGKSFYRSSRESFTGLGFEFLCGSRAAQAMIEGHVWGGTVGVFEKTMLSKNNHFTRHYEAIAVARPTRRRS